MLSIQLISTKSFHKVIAYLIHLIFLHHKNWISGSYGDEKTVQVIHGIELRKCHCEWYATCQLTGVAKCEKPSWSWIISECLCLLQTNLLQDIVDSLRSEKEALARRINDLIEKQKDVSEQSVWNNAWGENC